MEGLATDCGSGGRSIAVYVSRLCRFRNQKFFSGRKYNGAVMWL